MFDFTCLDIFFLLREYFSPFLGVKELQEKSSWPETKPWPVIRVD